MADLLRAYWRIPPWLRLTGILAVVGGHEKFPVGGHEACDHAR